jgi:hypothetical protein
MLRMFTLFLRYAGLSHSFSTASAAAGSGTSLDKNTRLEQLFHDITGKQTIFRYKMRISSSMIIER